MIKHTHEQQYHEKHYCEQPIIQTGSEAYGDILLPRRRTAEIGM